MKKMNKGKSGGENKSPATIKGGGANGGDVKAVMKECGSYSKSYGSMGGKKKAQK